ncbi:NADP-dependent phosphogluconate dehydrogenase [Echinicola salinicaeni]|uniref:NADP-dependent phosphogluconate dehydrogenase n=1 Tax=Echinicola salinicaeni TaxID=2762757 RepID=UPI0016456B27|nr:NADP-dependent phosphogluconate dehydrogenase [Echinicola salinicaeni]
MGQYDFGIVGLGVMGRNLLLNMADHGFAVAGLDLDEEKALSLEKEAAKGHKVKGFTAAEDFIKSLKNPKAIMLLVPAGRPVDAAIASLLPFMGQGDIIVDGGNSYFPDTDRRFNELADKGIHFFGMGISGGEKGARFGPSMMPGGDAEAYERLRPVFEAIAAKVDGEPCVTYLGRGSAGNYVKMVHNGIEYGIMQLIAETYDIMKRGLGLDDVKIQETFEAWNQSELQSFLVEITAKLLKKVDETTGKHLVSLISDRARSKGTGKWTSQNAMDLQAPVPVIDVAVLMRDISKFKEERESASKTLLWNPVVEKDASLDMLKNAFYFAMITTYAQGMAQLSIASKEYDYGLNLEEVAKIWRGGCIIRAVCLEDFRQAYSRNADLPNLLLDEKIGQDLVDKQKDIRELVKIAVDQGVPAPAFMASLGYFDSYRSEILPTNVIQAQRDFFGAHQFERIDKEGIFHAQWE